VRWRFLRIQLLGNFHLSYDEGGEPIVFTPWLQSLLTYLLLHRGTPQSRQHLAFLFWPDTTEAQSRNNLRQALHQLRGALPDAATFLEAETAYPSLAAECAIQPRRGRL